MVTLKLLSVRGREIVKDQELLNYYFPDQEEPYFEFHLKDKRTIIIFPGADSEIIIDIEGEEEEKKDEPLERKIVRMRKGDKVS